MSASVAMQAAEHEVRWRAALVGFNLDPVAYADAGWLPAWAPSAAPRVRRALSADLLREQGLEDRHDWVLDDRATRLFLIEPTLLLDVRVAVGIAAHRDSLRQTVRHADLATLRHALGEALDTLWLPIAETVERSLTPLPRPGFAVGDLRVCMADEGGRQLLRLIDGRDPSRRAAAGRAALCLPRRLQRDPLPPLGPAAAARMSDAIIDSLVPRWAPAWTWLF